jgi:hypothetical protein
MKFAEPYGYQAQFPNKASWEVVHPSYLTIGGSGVVGDAGAESPMSASHEPTYPENIRAAGPMSGDGAAAGAAPTYGGSGVA